MLDQCKTCPKLKPCRLIFQAMANAETFRNVGAVVLAEQEEIYIEKLKIELNQ